MIFYQDNDTTLHNGDARHMDALEDGSVQCVVTSPPYWGLRKYAGVPDLIWGGDPDCSHQWGSDILGDTRADAFKDWGDKGSGIEAKHIPVSQGAFCQCGAWRGSYGLEPTPEAYVSHTIEVLREVRRVLRPDGVAFVNLGDSYSSGSAKPYGTSGIEPPDSRPRGCASPYPSDACPVASALRTSDTDHQPCGGSDGDSHGPSQAHTASRTGRSDTSGSLGLTPTPRSAAATQGQQQSGDHADERPRASQESTQIASADGSPQSHVDPVCSGCLWFQRSASHSHYTTPSLKPKDLVLIPFRVALAAQADGWWVRSIIIWDKANPMPESVRDRPTTSHEYIIMLTKSARYYWNQEAVREQNKPESEERYRYSLEGSYTPGSAYPNEKREAPQNWKLNPAGRNIRSVWSFPSQPYAAAHFATFPEALPERCIKAATPEVGCCENCGAPWERQTNTTYTKPRGNSVIGGRKGTDESNQWGGFPVLNKAVETTGWQPTCSCDAGKVPSVVLDPFAGSCRTLWVAKRLGRRSVGYDLSRIYCELGVKGLHQQSLL